MAELVLGIGTSHSPMLSTPPELWSAMAAEDRKSSSLVDPDSGEPVSYEELLARRGARPVDASLFPQQWQVCQAALQRLGAVIREVAPDVLVIVSADQRELLFDDNMSMLQVYWGDTVRLVPRYVPEQASAVVRSWTWGYGDVEMDLPVASDLGRHLIEYLVEEEFDVAHSRYLRSDLLYGGEIAPAGHIRTKIETPVKRQGIGHGWGFVVKRLLDNRPIPMVPLMQNATYPPNMPTPGRCYKLGGAIARAIRAWASDKRVCVVASGGLSHFVTDETIDRVAIKAMLNKDEVALCNLPRNRLLSASAEIRNWITCAGACQSLEATLIDYVPVYRSDAGTGGGWAFMTWR